MYLFTCLLFFLPSCGIFMGISATINYSHIKIIELKESTVRQKHCSNHRQPKLRVSSWNAISFCLGTNIEFAEKLIHCKMVQKA